MFVQATKSRRNGKTYVTHLVRESFRTPDGPRSRTVCNISKLPEDVRKLVAESLSGRSFVEAEAIGLERALDCGGLAVLVEAWRAMGLDQLLAGVGTARDRSLIKAMVFSRLLFPCAKLALKDRRGTLLAPACGLPPGECFDEDDLYAAMDAITGHWCALEKGLAAGAFKEPVSLVLYDLTSVYFEGAGPKHIARYGHSRDHRGDRPQIILAVATDTAGTPLHLSVLRGNRADTSTLQGFLKILQRRFGIREAVFVFDGGMSSKVNLGVIQGDGLNFVTRLSNATLEALLKELPDGQQLELGDSHRLVEIEHGGRRHVIAGAPGAKSATGGAARRASPKPRPGWPNSPPPNAATPTRKKSRARPGAPSSASKPTNTSPTASTSPASCTGSAKPGPSPPRAPTTDGIFSTPA